MKIADLNVMNSIAFIPNLSNFDFKHAASKVINAFQMNNKKNVEIILKVSKEHLQVQSDLQRWQQVVLNMLQNALTQSVSNASICIELFT